MATQTTRPARSLKNSPFSNCWVVVRGGGDIASGPIQRLRWAGFPVIVTELPQPLVVRRLVSFSNAVYEGECDIEGTPAKLVQSVAAAQQQVQRSREIVPVIVDPEARVVNEIRPFILIDGRMAKKPLDTHIDQAPIVIGLGPGFEAGIHVDAVVETKGGSQCGRTYFAGLPIEDDGTPCVSSGYREERVIRAPSAGIFEGCKNIGDVVEADETVGWIHASTGEEIPVEVSISGILRGLLHNGLKVPQGIKLGDIDHRGESSDCCRVSEKADSVASGVLEAILRLGVNEGLFSALAASTAPQESSAAA